MAAPSLSMSTGSFRIRAPVTLDDDDTSDVESSGYKTETDSSVSHTSTSIDNNNNNEYKSEGFASGAEDFETASERQFVGDSEEKLVEESVDIDKVSIFRPFVAKPAEENAEKSVNIDKVSISRPFVGNPDEESLDKLVVANEIGVSNEYSSANANLVMPIAQLSLDDDDFIGMVGDDEGVVSEEEDSKFSGIVKVPSFGVLQRGDSTPRVKVLSAEEDELSFLKFNPTEAFPLSDNEDSASGEYFGGVSDSKNDVGGDESSISDSVSGVAVENGSASCTVSVGLVDVEGHVVTPEAHVVYLVESKEDVLEENLEAVEDDNCVVVESVLDEQGKDVGLNVQAELAAEDEFSGGVPGSVVFEKGSESEKLEDETRLEPDIKYKLSFAEDAIKFEPAENFVENMSSVQNCELAETSRSDRLEDEWQSNTDVNNIKDVEYHNSEKVGEQKKLLSDEDIEELIFGHHGTILPTFSHSEAEGSPDHTQEIDEQIVMDSDEEVEEKAQRGMELFDSAAVTSLLEAVTGVELSGGRITTNSASSGSSFLNMRPTPQLDTADDVVQYTLSEEEKKMMDKMHQHRVKFLRLVQRLGQSYEDTIVAEVLHRLVSATKAHFLQEYSLESVRRMAMQLEAEGKDDLDFSLNILVLGKTGVGKSATVNSIFGERRVMSSAFEPGTTKVKEIVGMIDGVRVRIIDTPGLRSSANEEAINRKILASVKKLMKRFPPDVVLYVDRLDTNAKYLNDLPLLTLLTNSLTASIWRNAIVTLTHAASPPPDGPHGLPLSFEVFVAQQSHAVQLAISQAVGDIRLMHPSMMHPVSPVENHPLCQNILPNGKSWRPQLLLLCYSLKILSEASLISKPRDPQDYKKLLGIHIHSLSLPYFLSSLLQSRSHPKLTADQGGDCVDSDVELVDLSDSDEDEDEYDQLPPFKPLRKSQVANLTKEQRGAYFEEYDYRVKLLQKKLLREEVKRLKEMKKKGKDGRNNSVDFGEDTGQEDEGPATVPVLVPDFVLPPSFDSDNPSYRYRMLEPNSELLVRPVLDSHGWDHDCGYDGISIERNIAVAGQFPGAFALQITKDKKELNIHLDSSICAKHGKNGSTMAGFDIQTVGRRRAYILRSETKVKNFKTNKTAGGISIMFLGKNIATGLKIEDQIAVGKCLALVGMAGAVTSGNDTAYGANFEVRLRSKDFPVEQDQSSLGLSLMKWKGDSGLMANLQSQFSVGRNSKMAIHIGMNKKRNGKITIKTSSSELQTALFGIVPVAISIFKSIYPGGVKRNSSMSDY